jgi:hypothetical protein
MALTPDQRILRARVAAFAMHSQGKTNTGPATRGFDLRFENQVDPDRKLSVQERAKRAEQAKRAYMSSLALKSSVARSKKKEAKGT